MITANLVTDLSLNQADISNSMQRSLHNNRKVRLAINSPDGDFIPKRMAPIEYS